jgi:CRP-like cAMP-binding protein
VETPGERIPYAYFLESALCSTIARTSDGDAVEVGVAGRDGVAGFGLALGAEVGVFESFIQIPGDAYRIGSADLLKAMDESVELRRILLLYTHAYNVQVAFTALTNARHTVLERISRWLLMCHDRVRDDTLALTHEFLSRMLGVRRAGITMDMHILEGEHAVTNRRGKVIVRDRARLEEFARDAYGDPEAVYERVIGQSLRRSGEDASSSGE